LPKCCVQLRNKAKDPQQCVMKNTRKDVSLKGCVWFCC
jgi:hypothetical protein